jgi:AcrR family transcriptional regulator
MLGAAAEVVLDSGVHGFSIDEVARRSGVAKTTIYRHFPGPKELLVAALDRIMTPPPTPDTGSLRGDLVEYLASVRPTFADAALRTVFFEVYAAAARDPHLAALHRSLMRARSGPTRAIYDHALARGEIAPDIDYPTMLEIVQGPLILRSMFRPRALGDGDLAALVDRMLTALAGAPTGSCHDGSRRGGPR